MAKLLSTRSAKRFVPADQKSRPEGEQIAFLLRVPTPYIKPQIDRAVRAAGARTVTHFQLLAVLAKGVEEVFALAGSGAGASDGDVRERVLAAITGYRDRILNEPDMVKRLEIVRDGDPEVDHAAAVLRREYPPFAALEADRDFHWEAWKIETARHCLIGWENLARPFAAAHHGGPDDASLAWLQALHSGRLQDILLEFERLRAPGEEEAKNSDSSSPIEAIQGTSTSAATSSSTPPKAPGRKTSGSSRKSAGRS